jgi:hypothetical protein
MCPDSKALKDSAPVAEVSAPRRQMFCKAGMVDMKLCDRTGLSRITHEGHFSRSARKDDSIRWPERFAKLVCLLLHPSGQQQGMLVRKSGRRDMTD